MEQIKIGFTGNRHGLNLVQKEQIELVLNEYDNIIASHGDCVGSDTEFHELCMKHKEMNPNKIIEIHIYPPNNPTLRAFNRGDLLMEEQPYLTRNLNILKNSNILIACPIDKNKEEMRSGTWSTIRQAKKRNMQIYIF